MNKPIGTENPEGANLCFSAAPRIGNRSDAIELLDNLMKADYVENMDIAIKALRDAIEREII